MYRRIELIDEMNAEDYLAFIESLRQSVTDPDVDLKREYPRFWKTGLMGYGNPAVSDAWLNMNSPRRPVNRNARFYFTEEGWRRYGRKTIEVCQQVGQRYRVLSVKESAVDVIYRDEFQVAVRPKKKARHKNTRGAP
jgi:hypothetical protein